MKAKWFLPLALVMFGCSDADSNNNSPISTPAMKSLQFGGTHQCALSEDKNMWCWGGNALGELGNGSKTDTVQPTKVPGLSNVAEMVIAGNSSCAILEDRSLWCWGHNSAGQLGIGDEVASTTPVLVEGPGAVKLLRLTGLHGCLIDMNDDLWCASKFLAGVESSTYKKIEGLSQVADVAIGFGHACALTKGNSVWCWGLNRTGQLGTGNKEDLSVPTQVPGIDDATAIYARGDATAIQRTNGEIWIWGSRIIGVEGDPDEFDSTVPQNRSSVKDFPLHTLSNAGLSHSCMMDANDEGWCWGNGNFGQLGTGDTNASSFPVKIKGLGPLLALSAGKSHSCALDKAGQVWCWGNNSGRALGIGEGDNQPEPQKVALDNVTSILAGDHQTCAIKKDGSVWCWGDLRVGRIDPLGGFYGAPTKQ